MMVLAPGAGCAPDGDDDQRTTSSSVQALASEAGASGDGGAVVPCGKVTVQGCCYGQQLRLCVSGSLQIMDCTATPKCGWDTGGKRYACLTKGTADPAGKYPMPCTGLPDLGVPKDTSAPPQLDGLPPNPDTGPAKTCGKVTAKGCCNGKELRLCVSGVLQILDCSSSPKCGWDSSASRYACNSKGAADPSGKNPMACTGIPDAGATGDTGPPPLGDGPKVPIDKGPKTDKGPPPGDKGATADKAASDTGPTADTSPAGDTGAATDKAAASDAKATSDAAQTLDGATTTPPATGDADDGCSVARKSGSPSWLFLLAALAFLSRRRRQA